MVLLFLAMGAERLHPRSQKDLEGGRNEVPEDTARMPTMVKRSFVAGMCAVGILCLSGGAAMASRCYAVWPELSSRKVFRETKPPERVARTLSISAARNEYEGGQIVVTAGKEGLTEVEVSCIPLEGPGGRRIVPALHRVAYIFLPAYGRDYPDPLAPLTKFNVEPDQSQPVWLSVYVPADAEPGIYHGTMTVSPRDAAPSRMAVSLRVYSFAIPQTPNTRTAFGLDYGHIAQKHGVEVGSDADKRLRRAYYEMLLSHRISAYWLPVDLMSDEAGQFLGDPRMTSHVIPYKDDAKQMKALVSHLRKGGWLAKGFFYPCDEPVNEEQYKLIKEQAKKVHSISRGLKVISPFFRNPEFSKQSVYELLDGTLDIWCAVSAFFDQTQAEMRKKQRQGQEGWWYVCCGPGKPYANFFVDFKALEHRMLFWQQKKYNIQGLLYWSTTYWNDTKDPWADIATVKWIGPNIYGDGSLMYPGKQVGFDGPVSSIRLEMIRDGLEDYEYLCLLEKARGKKAVDEAIARVVTDMKKFTRSAPLLERTRRQIADEIEGSGGASGDGMEGDGP